MYKGKPNLQFDVLSQIREVVDISLVLCAKKLHSKRKCNLLLLDFFCERGYNKPRKIQDTAKERKDQTLSEVWNKMTVWTA